MDSRAMDKVRGRVLVVDDEEAVCRLLCQALDRVGFDVTTATSGSEALAVLECERPDLIIMELALRGMDGIETLKRMRERGETPPVVVLTAYGTAERLLEALELGVREFLGKPFQLDRLVTIVGEIVSEETARKVLRLS